MDLLLFTLLSLSLVLRSAGGSSLCSFDLNYDLCVEHLSVPGSRGCDKLTSQLEVQFGATSIHFKTQGVRWSGQELEELEASVEQNGAEFKYSVVNENISELGKDLVRGISRVLYTGDLPDHFPAHSCSTKHAKSEGNGREKISVNCERSSQQQFIYHIHHLKADREVVRESGLLKELQMRETFLYFSNLDRKLGVEVSTWLTLHRKSECRKYDYILPISSRDDDMAVSLGKEREKTKISVDQILKEKNVLKLVDNLKRALLDMSEDEVTKLLKKQRKSSKLNYILEAAGSTGVYPVFKAVHKLFPLNSKQTSGSLERYLIALSYTPNLDDRVLDDIIDNLNNLKPADKYGAGETALYCICRQYGLKHKDKDAVAALLKIAGDLHCLGGYCNLKPTLMCLHALHSDEYTEEMLDVMERSKEGEVETGAVLLPPGLEHHQERVWAMLRAGLPNNAFFKLLDLLDLAALNASTIQHLLQTDDVERRAYTASSLGSQLDTVRTDYSILSYALQGKSVYVRAGLTGGTAGGSGGEFRFSTTAGASGAVSRTSFALNLRDATNTNRQLINIQSFIGGLSSFVGEGDSDDDEEANASIQITLLGLPLRPLVLFSSVGDLINMYWSGAGQEKTTLMEGSLPLEEDDQVWESFGGVRVRVQSTLGLHIHSSGQGSVSIWDSSGSSSLVTAVSLAGTARVQIQAPDSVFVKADVRLNTALTVDTQAELGNGLVCCVKMRSEELMLELALTTRDNVATHNINLPGQTWNINKKNNVACSNFG